MYVHEVLCTNLKLHVRTYNFTYVHETLCTDIELYVGTLNSMYDHANKHPDVGALGACFERVSLRFTGRFVVFDLFLIYYCPVMLSYRISRR